MEQQRMMILDQPTLDAAADEAIAYLAYLAAAKAAKSARDEAAGGEPLFKTVMALNAAVKASDKDEVLRLSEIVKARASIADAVEATSKAEQEALNVWSKARALVDAVMQMTDAAKVYGACRRCGGSGIWSGVGQDSGNHSSGRCFDCAGSGTTKFKGTSGKVRVGLPELRVKVVRGKKVPRGTEGVIFWQKIEDGKQTVGIRKDDGTVAFVPSDYLALA